MTGPRAAAAAAPEPRCRGCRHPRRTRRGSSGPAGGSPLCGAGLRRRPRLRASGGARARGWAPWRRGCVPGNRRPAAAAAPSGRPASPRGKPARRRAPPCRGRDGPRAALRRAPLRARRLARRRPDCRNGRPGGTPAAIRVGCGDPRGSRGAASATGDLLAARGGRRGPRDGRWSSFPKVSGGTGDSRVKREQHVHRRQAIKTTLEHARSPASARAHAASIPGMTPLSRSSRVTLQSWEPSPSLLLKFLVHQAFFDILTLLM